MRDIDGPGVWVSCNIGKEKQCVAEIYNLFQEIGDELWPSQVVLDHTPSIIEERIQRELQILRLPPRERRFVNCNTGTSCLVFMQCNEPVDPVALVMHYLAEVEKSRIIRTKYSQRLIPVSAVGPATMNGLEALAAKIVPGRFADLATAATSYKVEMKIRNHNVLDKQAAIDQVVKSVPTGHFVDLERPNLVILVEIFKNVCGISVVTDYCRYQKFSPIQVIQT